jgi:hypothetical protein
LPELKRIAAMPVPVPAKADIHFDITPAAAKHNTELLRKHDYDIPCLLASQQGSTADFVSEFRPIEQLWRLLRGHPGFPELERVIASGMDYRFTRELPEDK